MVFNPCCCGCLRFRDDFDGGATSFADPWNVDDGTWTQTGGQAVVTSGGALRYDQHGDTSNFPGTLETQFALNTVGDEAGFKINDPGSGSRSFVSIALLDSSGNCEVHFGQLSSGGSRTVQWKENCTVTVGTPFVFRYCAQPRTTQLGHTNWVQDAAVSTFVNGQLVLTCEPASGDHPSTLNPSLYAISGGIAFEYFEYRNIGDSCPLCASWSYGCESTAEGSTVALSMRGWGGVTEYANYLNADFVFAIPTGSSGNPQVTISHTCSDGQGIALKIGRTNSNVDPSTFPSPHIPNPTGPSMWAWAMEITCPTGFAGTTFAVMLFVFPEGPGKCWGSTKTSYTATKWTISSGSTSSGSTFFTNPGAKLDPTSLTLSITPNHA